MKNNIENVPNEIFEWISSISFQELSTENKKTVLQYFTEDEYRELYESNAALKQTIMSGSNIHSGKAELMNLFDDAYPKKKQQLQWSGTLLWKAASVLLLISTCWFAFKKPVDIIVSNTIKQKKDTVFIERAVAVTRKPDTVYAETSARVKFVKSRVAVKKDSKITPPEETLEEYQKAYTMKASNADFQVLSVSSIHNVSNASKRNSMNDDSLEKNFKFVSL